MYTEQRNLERFNRRYIPVTETGCWLWIGTWGKDGYGNMRIATNKIVGAHRVSHLLHKGPLIEGMQVHHKCRTPACVNPDHLNQVPPAVNLTESNCVSAINARKTHCINGHELSGKNLYVYKHARHCRTCRERNDKVYLAKRKQKCL